MHTKDKICPVKMRQHSWENIKGKLMCASMLTELLTIAGFRNSMSTLSVGLNKLTHTR